jgi:glycerophosphoryl diester phosphodiesterase
MTKDGVVVVSHDPTGERMAGVATEIRSESFARVSEWDVSRGFKAKGGAPEISSDAKFRIPELDEVLSSIPDITVNIDAKQTVPDMVPALLRVIRKHDATKRVRLASFSDANLRRIRKLGYEGETSLGPQEIAVVRALPASLLRAFALTGKRAQIPRKQGPIALDSQAFITKCHAIGIGVDYWTINDPEEARELRRRGADGVVTDDPRTIIAALRAPR